MRLGQSHHPRPHARWSLGITALASSQPCCWGERLAGGPGMGTRQARAPLILPRAAKGQGGAGGELGPAWGQGGGPTLLGSPEARREGSCLPKHKFQATSSSGAQGRAGKPQFITKMENDTSPHASPGEGLIYDCARARTFVSAARRARRLRGH